MVSQPTFESGYLALLRRGELDKRVKEAVDHLADCDLCPWDCRINRFEGKTGFCKIGRDAWVSSAFPHRGEEDPLSGRNGSGTIFFTYCNLRCQYCQNYTISQEGDGHPIDTGGLAARMLTLQALGCHNINFVTPSHVVAQIIEAVAIAAESGLHVPLVYNTGGYDSLPALKLLDGIIDIYMPDMKYGDSAIGQKYSKIKDYVAINQTAVREMHRQVGDLKLDERGIAQRGLLIRHLVLPGGLAGTKVVSRFLAEEISKDTYINIMGQYRPEYKARREDLGHLSRGVTVEEIAEAHKIAREAGLRRFDQRRRLSWLAF